MLIKFTFMKIKYLLYLINRYEKKNHNEKEECKSSKRIFVYNVLEKILLNIFHFFFFINIL